MEEVVIMETGLAEVPQKRGRIGCTWVGVHRGRVEIFLLKGKPTVVVG